MKPHVIVIDNRDSFTYNLVYDLEALGATVEVYRNDATLPFLIERAAVLDASFVFSPGPGAPRDAGVCIELIRAATGRFGVLGICLGHQAIVEALGGCVARAKNIVHGRASTITCTTHTLFDGMPRRVRVARYHSLAADAIPEELDTLAATDDGIVMAVAHRRARIAGFQFHPESILTANGQTLLANALAWITTRETADATHA